MKCNCWNYVPNNTSGIAIPVERFSSNLNSALCFNNLSFSSIVKREIDPSSVPQAVSLICHHYKIIRSEYMRDNLEVRVQRTVSRLKLKIL